jgi:membrane-associated phospholipid phosphatase
MLLAFLAALGVVTAACVPSPAVLLGAIAVMAACIVALARLRGRSPILRVAHAFVCVPVLGALLNAVGPAIARLNPARYDRALAAIDARFFGPLVHAWMNALGRPGWLTDAASLAYASYYVLPIACAAVLYRQARAVEFERLVFSLSAILLASYAAYFIAPAAGPRLSLAEAQERLGGSLPSAALRVFLQTFERNELDAFPSGHTATSLVFLFEAWPMFRRQRFLFAGAVAAIIFSTVYLSLHYVIDVVAGAALAGLVFAALRRYAASRVRSDRWAPASASGAAAWQGAPRGRLPP